MRDSLIRVGRLESLITVVKRPVPLIGFREWDPRSRRLIKPPGKQAATHTAGTGKAFPEL